MSNKKQQPYIGKPTAIDPGSVPPRYQPPPQPGILKHVPPAPPAAGAPSQPPVHLKDAKLSYPQKIPPETLKANPQLNDNNKFYPQPNHLTGHINPPPNFPNSQFPPQPQSNQLGIPLQHRQHRLPSTEEEQRQEFRARNFEEEARNLHGLPPNRVHRLPEGFNRGIPHQKSQEELSQIPQRPHEDFNRPQVIVPHRPTRFSDEELLRLTPVEMLKFVRKSEGDSARITQEQHRHIQGLINEIRTLKEANQRLGDDNQELRDLCCFLDDDRQKGRKLAREWQRFGRYTASVMRQEVSAYQNKLRELDNKQQELIKDNLELKQLCLYLDEERGGSSVCPSCGSATSGGLRDDGDGSSSSTNADEPAVPNEFNGGNAPRRSASRERLLHESLARQRSTFNDQTMQYVRSLEQRVKQLEDEKRLLQSKMSNSTEGDTIIANGDANSNGNVLSGRPEAVVRALQVLEVREQLEREGRMLDRDPIPTERNDTNGSVTSDMDDGEKALVREMCNVVWRKLEEAPVRR